MLKMLVIPLILTSIIHSILNIGTTEQFALKKVSFFACIILLGMTALSSLIAIFIGQLFSVGQGLTLPDITPSPTHEYTGLVDTLLAMLPSNPIAAMTNENTVAIVILAVLLGLAARNLDEHDHDKMRVFRDFIASLFAVVKKLASLILKTTPYAIFALMSLLIVNQGVALLVNMFTYLIAVYVAIFCVFIMHAIFLLIMGFNLFDYYKYAYIPLLVAFTTRSSFGTLPVTEETLKEKFKVSQTVSTFVPSIGSTIGMNACAGVFPAILAVMALSITHQPLTYDKILMIMGINAIASIGISGIPGTAFIAATVTLTSLNLPYAIVALVQGIDPIVDMGRTAANVNGVITTSLIVDKMMPNKLE
jgi:L-cystine uptake protein TcyP (sodium:dicarboxylate symporter family)